MGLFKNQEEKDAAEEQKLNNMLEKRGLRIDQYDEKDIRSKNVENIKRINQDLKANGMFKASLALSFAKAEEQAKVSYLSALVEQNWILIRQNEAILRKLDRLK